MNERTEMIKRTLPKTAIRIAPLVYGAFAIGGWFWGGNEDSDAMEAIHAALEQGINAIDTAPIYGMGHSEDIVGEAVQGRRDKVVLLTKFGMRWDGASGTLAFDTKDNSGSPVKVYKFNGKESVIEECERSLSRLRTDYIDLYQMHWPDHVTPISETMEALEMLLQQGKIRAVGVCNCPKHLLEGMQGSFPLTSDQVAYSMGNREIELELVRYCMKNDIGILSHTVLQKGLLTGKIKPGHRFSEGDHRSANAYFTSHNIAEFDAALRALQPIADGKNVTLSQLAINWTMNRPGVVAVLVGARNAKQVRENAGAMHFRLTAEENQAVETVLQTLRLEL